VSSSPPPQGQKSSLGLDANLAGMLAYAGFFIFSGVILLLLEKRSRTVRFHAAQSVLVAISLTLVYAFLGVIPGLWLLGPVVWLGSVVLWLFLMFKAYRGEQHRLPVIGDLAWQYASR
jgi:uncharacterized membrane protein